MNKLSFGMLLMMAFSAYSYAAERGEPLSEGALDLAGSIKAASCVVSPVKKTAVFNVIVPEISGANAGDELFNEDVSLELTGCPNGTVELELTNTPSLGEHAQWHDSFVAWIGGEDVIRISLRNMEGTYNYEVGVKRKSRPELQQFVIGDSGGVKVPMAIRGIRGSGNDIKTGEYGGNFTYSLSYL